MFSLFWLLYCIFYLFSGPNPPKSLHLQKASLHTVFISGQHLQPIVIPLHKREFWSSCLHHFLDPYLLLNCRNLASDLTTDITNTGIKPLLFPSLPNHSPLSGFGLYGISVYSDAVGYPHLHENPSFVSVVLLLSLQQFLLSLIYKHPLFSLSLTYSFSSRFTFGPHLILHTFP